MKYFSAVLYHRSINIYKIKIVKHMKQYNYSEWDFFSVSTVCLALRGE